MPHLLLPGVIGLAILAVIALKTIEGGGDWLDFLNGTARYEAAKTNFEFALMFFMVGAAVVGIVGYAVFAALASAPVSQVRPQPVTASQPVTPSQHKSHTVAHSHPAHSSHKAGGLTGSR